VSYNEDLRSYIRSSEPIPFIRSTVPEPGRKVRIVTMAPECVTLFLQPFGHQMVEVLKMEPCVNAGLTRGYQAWEYYLRMKDSFLNNYEQCPIVA